MVEAIKLKIRTKKLGILLRDARLASGNSLKNCAVAIGVTTHRIGSFERGATAPSLPELEGLAYFLNTPLDHFLGDGELSTQYSSEAISIDKVISLRQRIVGAKLRASRQEAKLSMTEVAKEIGVTPHILKLYEHGERPIPLPELEIILRKLEIPIDEFRDQSGPLGQWVEQQRAIEKFTELPPEIQAFVAKPVNLSYLQLAQRLSEMSVDRLRSVAEGLLDITL